MKFKFLLVLFSFSKLAFGQSNELVLLKGKIICPTHELSSVNVYNLRSESNTSTNQNGERTCVEPGDLSGSKTTRENARCSVGESVYSLSHF